ncbi:MAG: ATP-dependent helicase HrpB [Azospirillaceae bacterium]
MTERAPLPIDDALPALEAALARYTFAVLAAPPGSGKTTRVPPFIARQTWAAGRKVLVLAPRRLAARSAARRIAAELGEAVGGAVGYRVRFDTRVGPDTRIEIVTEGILTRMIQADPALDGVACIVFDEFHERSLDGDLGLALALDSTALNPELSLVVMSATLDTERIGRFLDDAPLVEAAGRSFPVGTEWLPRFAVSPSERRRIGPQVAAAVRHALATGEGSVLAFLPGLREIADAGAALADLESDRLQVHLLHGGLPLARQDAAIAAAAPGQRKVVLATNIAETSLTIEGVDQVVDSGLARRLRYDPGMGMGRMETVRISRASADQRRGRAGRTGPGRCLRLWGVPEDRALVPFDPPEIAVADLAPLALDLACWGARPEALRWLDQPPAAAYREAEAVLADLGALDADGRVTAAGRAIAAMQLHPRLARMVLAGQASGHGSAALVLAMLVEERPRGGANDDLERDLIAAVEHPGVHGPLLKNAGMLCRRLGLGRLPQRVPPGLAGRLLAEAFTDRIARRRRGGEDRYLTLSGRGVALAPESRLTGAAWIVAADLAMRPGGDALVRRGAVADAAVVMDRTRHLQHTRRGIDIDFASDRLQAVEEDRLGAIVLARHPWRDASDADFRAALVEALKRSGVGALGWPASATRLRQRLAFLHQAMPADWPDVGDTALTARLEDWLAPYLEGIRTMAALRRLDLAAGLMHLVGWQRRETIDVLAPERLVLPSGRPAAIDYADPDRPVLAAKLQELFGWQTAPAIADGRAPLTVELLSPAGRPLAVSGDLEHFWREAYPQVRKEMRGRYPKHPWPEDPLQAEATALTKKRLATRP